MKKVGGVMAIESNGPAARWTLLAVILLTAGSAATAGAQSTSAPSWPPRPPASDSTVATLNAYTSQVQAYFGGDYRQVPLDVKAEFFEWLLWRYNQGPTGQVYDRAVLPADPNQPMLWIPGSDTSTWNGSLLAGLSYKYAVTNDPAVLHRITSLLQAMHLSIQATQTPGLIARAISLDGTVPELYMKGFPNEQYPLLPYTAPDGTKYWYRSDPAKGTYNQIVAGYAKVLMHAGAQLHPDVRQMAEQDLAALVVHVVDHDYKLTYADGTRTKYGDLTPKIGPMGVPFNAQVAYMLLASGYGFCTSPEVAGERERILNQYRKLRGDHVYYANPWRNLVRPQMVAGGVIIKGMNDRMHAMYAAFTGLELEIDHARRYSHDTEEKFLYRLGQTMHLGMGRLQVYNNSLCHFMWAAMLANPDVFEALIHHKPNTTRAQAEDGLSRGIENLRRFTLNRFAYDQYIEHDTQRAQWADQLTPAVYQWHLDSARIWEPRGNRDNRLYAAIDYLHAYWMMRYYQLDQNPAATKWHASVLVRTPDAARLSLNPTGLRP